VAAGNAAEVTAISRLGDAPPEPGDGAPPPIAERPDEKADGGENVTGELARPVGDPTAPPEVGSVGSDDDNDDGGCDAGDGAVKDGDEAIGANPVVSPIAAGGAAAGIAVSGGDAAPRSGFPAALENCGGGAEAVVSVADGGTELAEAGPRTAEVDGAPP
jgi:hypothetical protein